MTGHKWKKDSDGAESCERVGCTVRRFRKVDVWMWQRQKGARWRPWSLANPIPPCAGKEAAEANSAPSPLEVVREKVFQWLEVGHDGLPSLKESATSALATLEESIRKDEREKCAEQVEDMFVGCNRMAEACGKGAATAIRNRK